MTLVAGACGLVVFTVCMISSFFFFVILCCYNHVVYALFACLPFSFVLVQFFCFVVSVPLYRKGCFPMGGV